MARVPTRRDLCAPGATYLASGMAFLALGLSGQASFLAAAPALLVLGMVLLLRARRGAPQP